MAVVTDLNLRATHLEDYWCSYLRNYVLATVRGNFLSLGTSQILCWELVHFFQPSDF